MSSLDKRNAREEQGDSSLEQGDSSLEEGECFLCLEPCSLLCPHCSLVHYCSQHHLDLHRSPQHLN